MAPAGEIEATIRRLRRVLGPRPRRRLARIVRGMLAHPEWLATRGVTLSAADRRELAAWVRAPEGRDRP
jgi:hypothetical protein